MSLYGYGSWGTYLKPLSTYQGVPWQGSYIIGLGEQGCLGGYLCHHLGMRWVVTGRLIGGFSLLAKESTVPPSSQLGRGRLCCWAYWARVALMNSVVDVHCWSDRDETGIWVDAWVQRE